MFQKPVVADYWFPGDFNLKSTFERVDRSLPIAQLDPLKTPILSWTPKKPVKIKSITIGGQPSKN